jgi:hypothetical protein
LALSQRLGCGGGFLNTNTYFFSIKNGNEVTCPSHITDYYSPPSNSNLDSNTSKLLLKYPSFSNHFSFSPPAINSLNKRSFSPLFHKKLLIQEKKKGKKSLEVSFPTSYHLYNDFHPHLSLRMRSSDNANINSKNINSINREGDNISLDSVSLEVFGANQWFKLWLSSHSIPVEEQKQIFDVELQSETCLDFLLNITPVELFRFCFF